MANSISKKIDASWSGGSTNLYFKIEGGKPAILDYEFDCELLHKKCGGKQYYCSRSGCSGAGYFFHLGDLTPLGYYRVDTAHNNWQCFEVVGKTVGEEDVSVAVPYVSHTKDKSEILRNYPTVIKVGDRVVYCDYYSNFVTILRDILLGKALPEECVIDGVTYGRHGHRTLTRTFTEPWSGDWEITLEHYNLCSMENCPNPWEFFSEKLKNFRAGERERVYQLLSVERLEDGTFVRTVKFDAELYRGEILPGDPLSPDGILTAGWQRLSEDVLVRFYDRSNEAHLLAYAKADEAYEDLAGKLAARMGEGEEFISFVSTHEGRYVEYELAVTKVLYQLDSATQFEEVRKGLAQKVRRDVMSRARQWIANVKDQTILEAIPDEMVVTIDDSLDAGNCRPGTEAFVSQYFPGQTQTTVGELKKYAGNYNVMRLFRHLAATGRFDLPVETTA